MARGNLTCWLAGIMVLAQSAAGGEQGTKKAPTAGSRAGQLVIGDRYAIDIDRQQVQQSVSGDLVQVTDQWIVLRRVLPSKEITSKSSQRMARLNKLIRNEAKKGKLHLSEDLWIPREGATITGHARAAHRTAEKVVAAKAPTTPAVGAMCCVELAGEGTIKERLGDLVEFTADGIEISRERRVAVQEVVPVVGDLPVVGTAFRRTRYESRQVREKIGLEHVLCLRILPDAGDEASLKLARDPEPGREPPRAR